MRMIDADTLYDQVLKMSLFDNQDRDIFLDAIDAQPTAYDVDEVIEELEAKAVCYDSAFDCWGKCEHCNNSAINRKEAVDIVKRGLKDDC